MRGVRRSPLTSTGGGALDASTRAAPPQPSDAGAADATPAAPNARNTAVTADAMSFFTMVSLAEIEINGAVRASDALDVFNLVHCALRRSKGRGFG